MKRKEIELVVESDQRYQSFCERLALENTHLRETLDATVIQKASEDFEQIIRDYLEQYFECTDSRILHYLLLQPNGEYQECFRELDAVIGTESNPSIIVEVKVTVNVDKMTIKAQKQVYRSWNVAKGRWYDIHPAIIIIALGEPHDSEDWGFSSLNQLQRIKDSASVKVNRAQDIIPTVITANELWIWAKEVGSINLDEKRFSEAISEAKRLIDIRLRRKLLRKRGVPEIDWPSELREDKAPETPELQTYSTGSDSPSELQLELMKAFHKNGNVVE